MSRIALNVEEKPSRLWRLKPGAEFEDYNGQQFRKLGVIVNRRGQRKHVVTCNWTRQGRKVPGPITGAFFTHIGAVLYLGGNQEIYRATRALALPAPERRAA